MKRQDVVIVGSGIAGSALGRALALAGRDVLILERETEYRDKVRGETMPPWGVKEVRALDIESILLDAGGHHAGRMVPYDEVYEPAEAEARPLPLELLVPDCPSFLDVGHPQACEALSRAAEAAGATVLRGVKAVEVTAGAQPAVRFSHDGEAQSVSTAFVIGADGRESSVRKQLGFTLEQTEPRIAASGLLVRDLHDWPDDLITLGTNGDCYHLLFPRAGGVARVYVMWDIADRSRFSGKDAARRMLEVFRTPSLPLGGVVADGTPAGPCATYAMNDSYVDVPFAEGIALMGDAAGWNDPIIGQGLSIALRDARLLRDILLQADNAPSAEALATYGDERRERMRRLRFAARVVTDIRCTFSEAGKARRLRFFDAVLSDPLVAPAVISTLAGPEGMPAEGFTEEAYQHILAL